MIGKIIVLIAIVIIYVGIVLGLSYIAYDAISSGYIIAGTVIGVIIALFVGVALMALGL